VLVDDDVPVVDDEEEDIGVVDPCGITDLRDGDCVSGEPEVFVGERGEGAGEDEETGDGETAGLLGER